MIVWNGENFDSYYDERCKEIYKPDTCQVALHAGEVASAFTVAQFNTCKEMKGRGKNCCWRFQVLVVFYL